VTVMHALPDLLDGHEAHIAAAAELDTIILSLDRLDVSTSGEAQVEHRAARQETRRVVALLRLAARGCAPESTTRSALMTDLAYLDGLVDVLASAAVEGPRHIAPPAGISERDLAARHERHVGAARDDARTAMERLTVLLRGPSDNVVALSEGQGA
jgi:hypothetical protein